MTKFNCCKLNNFYQFNLNMKESIFITVSISPEVDEFREDICWYEPPESETICIEGGSSGILQK